ncbi:MAG: endonuclease/exonuclease/phosphatase family protein [Candidatus Pacearchaeota archaeon]
MELKVMEYNVLNGFLSWDCSSFESERLESSKQVVKEYSPDVLVLAEAVVYDNSDKGLSLQDYAYAFGYNFAAHGKAGSKDVVRSNVVLSNYYLEGEDFSLPGFSFLRTRVSLDNFKLNLDVVHPKPQADDEERASFFRGVLRDSGERHIITGDFNSISPEDSYDKEKIRKGFSKVYPGMEDLITGNWFKMKAVQELIDHGFKDSFKSLNESGYTVPTDLCSKNKDTAVRLDYLFTSRDIDVLDSGIIQNEMTNKASDHHPIYAKLRIN